jgi:hypothetical protein
MLTRHLVILAFYGLLALLVLAAPLFHIGTAMVWDANPLTTTDFYHFHWNYWWIRHALTTGLNVYETSYVFAPATSSLGLHTLAPFWYPVWALIEPAFGTIAAMLGVYFVALVLNGYVFHVFLEVMGSKPGFAFVGGVLLMGSSVMLESIRWTMVSLMGWFWLPLVIVLWVRIVRALPFGIFWCALLGISLWAMILTDLQYALFLAFLFLPIVLWSMVHVRMSARTWFPALRLIGFGTAALLLALMLLALTGTLSAVLSFDRSVLATTPAERAPDIRFPDGYLLRLEQGISLGVLTLPLMLAALWIFLTKRSAPQSGMKPASDLKIPSWLWLFISLPPLVLSAGDAITVAGAVIRMPYLFLHDVLGGTFRYPERFANVFLIAACAFALPVLSKWLQHVTQGHAGQQLLRIVAVGSLLLVAIADTRLLEPLPLKPIPPVYAFYRAMGEEPYDYVVVEVPTAGASGEGIVGRSEWAAAQFYGMTHGKRMINGHLSRVDPWRFLYMETSDPMLAWLGQRRYLEVDLVREQLAERIYSFPIGYMVIHERWLPENDSTLQEIVGFLNAQTDLVCLHWIESDAIVYRTAWHPEGCAPRIPDEVQPGIYEIDIGSSADQRFIGWGWHWRESVGGMQWRWMGEYPRLGGDTIPVGGFLHSDLYLELPNGEYTLLIEAQAFASRRTLNVLIDGSLIGTASVEPGTLQEIRFTIPDRLAASGHIMQMRFTYDDVARPADIDGGSDGRRLSVAINRIRFERRW